MVWNSFIKVINLASVIIQKYTEHSEQRDRQADNKFQRQQLLRKTIQSQHERVHTYETYGNAISVL